LAENPLMLLGRVLGGVVLMQGGIGPQVLGQLLILGTNEVAVAGATVVVAATSRQRNAVVQAAIRTAVPAIAIQSLIQRDLARLEARERREQHAAKVAHADVKALKQTNCELKDERNHLSLRLNEATMKLTALSSVVPPAPTSPAVPPLAPRPSAKPPRPRATKPKSRPSASPRKRRRPRPK
jgi:hypothetical protein